ncbi:MAG: hypothetical protein KBT03_12820 [Bacteroidales bacterium]|nr:hypothetical protein [Candidatus Scybalousia scybalohippi]
MGTIADKLNYTQTSVNSIRNAIKQKNDAYVIDSPLADAVQAILDISGGGSGGGYDVKSGTIDEWVTSSGQTNRFYLSKNEKPVSVIFYEQTRATALKFDSNYSTTQYQKNDGTWADLLSETYTSNNNFIGYGEKGMFLRVQGAYTSYAWRYIAIFENKESRMTEMRTAIGAKATATATFNFEVKAALIFWNASTTAGYYEPLRAHPNAEVAYKDENGMTLWVFRGNAGSNTTAPTADGIFIDGNTVSVRYGTQGNSNCFICAFNYVPDEIKKAIDG